MLGVRRPTSPAEVAAMVVASADRGVPLCPAGTLHSMGGQQFARGGISISSSGLQEIGPLDPDSGTVWVQAGVRWPRLIRWLLDSQQESALKLSIIQKQTGADELSLGGAVSSNIHGRVLGHRPIVDDIEAFYVTNANGDRVRCSRVENTELFSLAVGGYGLLGFIDSVSLRLQERKKLLIPNPPKDTDGRREDSGRGVRELQGRWPGLHWGRWEVGGRSSVAAQGPYGRLRELRCAGWRENTQQGTLADRGGASLRGRWVSCSLAVRPGVEWLAAGPRRE